MNNSINYQTISKKITQITSVKIEKLKNNDLIIKSNINNPIQIHSKNKY